MDILNIFRKRQAAVIIFFVNRRTDTINQYMSDQTKTGTNQNIHQNVYKINVMISLYME